MIFDLTLANLKRACARVVCGRDVSTGYLVASNRLMTCWHAVEAASSGAPISCKFSEQEVKGTLLQADREGDWALVQLDSDVKDVQPLRTSDSPQNEDWVSYGFPSLAQGQGVTIVGNVRDPRSVHARTQKAQIQLYSDDAAAGRGPRLEGFSGSPIVSTTRGVVIGHLKSVIKDYEGGASLGLVYGCSAALFHGHVPIRNIVVNSSRAPNTPYDRLWYVHRSGIETEALARLRDSNSPVILQAPEQFGKSWLVSYLCECLEQEDLQQGKTTRFGKATLPKAREQRPDTPALTAAQVLELILQAFNPAGKAKPTSDALSELEPSQLETRFRERFDRAALRGQADRVVLILDGLDELLGSPAANIVLKLLRALALDETTRGKKLRLIVTVSIDPSVIESAEHSAFFALTPQRVLESFSEADLEMCARRYGTDFSADSLKALFDLVAGHPYLSRVALYNAALKSISLSDLLKNNPLKNLFGTWLNYQKNSIRVQAHLVQLCAAAGSKKNYFKTDKVTFNELYRRGLVSGSDDKAQITCPLFRDYFRTISGLIKIVI